VDEPLAELRQRLAEIQDLERALGVLGWDQRTMMPAGGAPGRAETLATLGGIHHEQLIDDELGRLLEAAQPYVDSLP
jgi:carboxypeptidase Taq